MERVGQQDGPLSDGIGRIKRHRLDEGPSRMVVDGGNLVWIGDGQDRLDGGDCLLTGDAVDGNGILGRECQSASASESSAVVPTRLAALSSMSMRNGWDCANRRMMYALKGRFDKRAF